IPQLSVGLPSNLIWLATAGLVLTCTRPRWVKLPVTTVVAPEFKVTVWHGGSVQPSTCAKHTVWEPGAVFTQFVPQVSAVLPSTEIWVDTAGDDVTRSRGGATFAQ